MSAHAEFEMPRPGQHEAIFEAAASLLSSVRMTPDQVERGYQVYVAGGLIPHEAKLDLLRGFAELEGLKPARVAASAILVRAYQIVDALADGIDLKKEVPAVYEDIMTGPITAAQLGFMPVEEAAIADLFS